MIGPTEMGRDQADAEGRLAGCRILVVEDDYFIAEDLCDCLRREGAEIVGPAGTVETALRLARQAEALDCAVLDLNLSGNPVDEVARTLARRSVGLLFATGYQTGGIAAEFAGVPRLTKPVDRRQLVDLIRRQVGADGQ